MNNIELLITGIFIGMAITIFSAAFIIDYLFTGTVREFEDEE